MPPLWKFLFIVALTVFSALLIGKAVFGQEYQPYYRQPRDLYHGPFYVEDQVPQYGAYMVRTRRYGLFGLRGCEQTVVPLRAQEYRFWGYAPDYGQRKRYHPYTP